MRGADSSRGPRDRIPLFPLATVALPGVPLPLRVFEPRYVALLDVLSRLPSAEREFGVIAIRRGHEVGPGRAGTLYAVGTAVRVEALQPADGVTGVLTMGVRRFRVEQVVADAAPYLVGEVTWLPEEDGPGAAAAAAGARTSYAAYARAAGSGIELPADAGPVQLSYLLLAAVRLQLGERQALLEAGSAAERLAALTRTMAAEVSVIRRLGALPSPLDVGGASLN